MLTNARFPYPGDSTGRYARHLTGLYRFRIEGVDADLGYMLPSTVAAIARPGECWVVEHGPVAVSDTAVGARRVILAAGAVGPEERSRLLEETVRAVAEKETFAPLLSGGGGDGASWADEAFSIFGPPPCRGGSGGGGDDGRLKGGDDVAVELAAIPRDASPLFGVVTYGVHLTVYERDRGRSTDTTTTTTTSSSCGGGGGGGGTPGSTAIGRVWVARRSRAKSSYPGMLDSCVGGSVRAGESPGDCLAREATEEASIPSSLVRTRATACGAISYFRVGDERAASRRGGAGRVVGMMQPECQYVYELDVTESGGEDDGGGGGPGGGGRGKRRRKGFEPRPNDGEVDEFMLYTVDELKAALAAGEFKPSSALVLLDFFVRHGILTPENEPDYLEIVRRIHRSLDFPLARF